MKGVAAHVVNCSSMAGTGTGCEQGRCASAFSPCHPTAVCRLQPYRSRGRDPRCPHYVNALTLCTIRRNASSRRISTSVNAIHRAAVECSVLNGRRT